MTPSDAGPAPRLHELISLLAATRELLGDAAAPLERLEERLRRLAGGEGERLRAAVAGTVKSGKSTLVNALIGRDFLKRGAGIVTSLVTRVRPGAELKAAMGLKGWADVNREATDAALFLGLGEQGRMLDLRHRKDRDAIAHALAELGEEALGEGGFFDKNAALLRAYLQGFAEVESLVRDEPRVIDFAGPEFERHRDFAGRDALAAYVDDLVLEIPGLPFSGNYELGDCQGYDSPNPRHMEKVQDYLMGCHLVVYVVSSRVGLREADLRFLRDIKAMGLLESACLVLNADLTEHATAEDLKGLRERVASELAAFRSEMPVYTFSALRSLFLATREAGEPLTRKDEILLELWEESPASGVEDYRAFGDFLGAQLGAERERRLAAAAEATARRVAASARTLLGCAMSLASRQAESLTAGEKSFSEAREQARKSLRSFEAALTGVADSMKRDLFRKVDDSFHPLYGRLAEEVLDYVKKIEPPPKGAEVHELKHIFRQLTRVYQEMRATLHRFKVEVVNAKAVAEIRAIWAEASAALTDSASPTAALLVRAVEAYRAEALALGIELPPLEVPEPDLSIGRRSIPLFSAVTYSAFGSTADRVLSFAHQWTRNLALGWASRLLGRKGKTGLHETLLADGAEAARKLLAEEAYGNLLHYNEAVKYQVLGASLEELAKAWARGYRERVEALVLDLETLARRIRQAGLAKEDLVPRLEEVLRRLEVRENEE
ncbi:MAG: dynamin family protein [Deltaproteobacteria bacterium]|nr:dynamin family protein [Deltaproteobacteria bacterium]